MSTIRSASGPPYPSYTNALLNGRAASGELQILAAAVSLAGEEVRAYDLGNLVTGLDTTNVTLLLDAVAHAAGWHQRHMDATITGRFDAVEQS